jgi:hypothetical protein
VTDPPVDRRRVVLVAVLSGLVIGSCGVTAYAYGGDVPRGTRVLGVDLGGRSRSDAERILHDRFDRQAGDPVEVLLNGRSESLVPAGIGLRLDVNLTVGAAVDSGGPLLFSERTSPPVIHLDETRLAAALGPGVDPTAAAAAIRSAWPVNSQVSLRTAGP